MNLFDPLCLPVHDKIIPKRFFANKDCPTTFVRFPASEFGALTVSLFHDELKAKTRMTER
jgi:hypothetical protein